MAVSKKRGDGFTGKLGNTVEYSLNGQRVRRSIGVITKDPTVPQEENRTAFGMATDLLKPVLGFISIGFEIEKKGTLLNAHNIAVSLNKKNAVTAISGSAEIDFTKAIFSKGILPVNEMVRAEITNMGVKFSWDPDFLIQGMKLTDQVMVMAYIPEKRCAFSVLDGARRKDGDEHVNLPRYHEHVTVHTYITFISSSRKSISDSLFTGTLVW